MFRSLTSRIPVIVLIAIIIGGFPNYMVQEAQAVVEVSFKAAGSTTTATDAVQACFLETDITNSGLITNATDWSIAGNTLTGGTVTFLDGTCSGADGVTITGMTAAAGLPLAADSTPTLELANVGLQHNGANTQSVAINIALTDGIAPTVSSAATTSSTTIVLTMTEAMTNTTAEAGDFTIGGVASTPTVTGLNVAGTSITLTLNAKILSTDTVTVTYNGDATDLTDAANNDLADFASQSVTNNVAAASGSHLGCAGDCTSPTIGLDTYQARMVDGGFSYNGNTVDVLTHHTPFPLISAQIGKTNTVIVKVYDEYGT